MNEIKTYTLKNKNGALLKITNYGATIVSLEVLNKFNKLTNVVVGLNNIEDYVAAAYQSHGLYLGSTIGRYAGRISNNGFELSEKKYKLYAENNVHLHGGKEGFDKKYWEVLQQKDGENPSITFAYHSKHLEEGYPGNLEVSLTYQLTENNEVDIHIKATTDRATPINLTNHAYFNLDGCKHIKNHQVNVNSSKIVAFNDQLLPTGKLEATNGTKLDLSKNEMVGKENFTGIDNIFILEEREEKASLFSKETGILMKVLTNQPALVVYTPKKFPNLAFTNNASFEEYPAICFEAECYPDAPNIAEFPSAILQPEAVYENKTTYAFSVIS